MSVEDSSFDYQRQVTRLCIHCALLLLQHGAESMLVDDLANRLGLALGMDNVESSISSNAIVLTTIFHDHCITTTRKSIDRGINMYMVSEVQHLVISAEKHQLSWQQVKARLYHITPFRHPNWLVVLTVGLACASFCRLANGSLEASLVTFIVASVAMFIRQRLAILKIHAMINVGITAFVATLLCGLIIELIPINTPSLAMASSILLLVPGFPLINAVADMFKGHVNTGIARWMIASLLALTTCIGTVLAMTLLGIEKW